MTPTEVIRLKTYNILGFNSGTETIQQYSQVSQQITTNLGDPAFFRTCN